MTASPGRGAASAPVINAPTQRVRAAGADFVYRELGADSGDALPLVALTHLGANLDSWDPEVVDPLAEDRRVLLIGYRGVGGSSGAAQQSFEAAADDVVAVIRALGVERVDLFGQSMGGMVAQAVLERAPQLVDRVVLAGSGPRGGPGLVTMGGVMIRGILRGVLTATDPIALLFFTRTPNGRSAAKALAARLTRRRVDRDSAVTLGVVRRQLGAVRRWGEEPPADSLFPIEP